LGFRVQGLHEGVLRLVFSESFFGLGFKVQDLGFRG